MGSLGLAAACHGGRGPTARAEADAVVRAVAVLRDAPNAEKAALLPPLAAVDCTAPDVCALRNACLDAYRLHVGALAERDDLTRVLAASGRPPNASARLAGIERDLTKAHALALDCAQGELALRARYRL
ncbi:MAG: hypothetical protein JW751_15710 [Polyangiaceae bacterium]|nr:hypothetical protein [Polyangiaceae bacterium]